MSTITIRPDAIRTKEALPNINDPKTPNTNLSVNSIALRIFNNITNQIPSNLTPLTRTIIHGLLDGIISGVITYVIFRILGIPIDNLAPFLTTSYILFGNDLNLFSSDSKSISSMPQQQQDVLGL